MTARTGRPTQGARARGDSVRKTARALTPGVLLLLAAFALAGSAASGEDDWEKSYLAQGGVAADEKPSRPVVQASATSSSGGSVDGWGINFRASHLAFETFGRDESITPLEFLPYYRWEDQLLFGDVRLFVGNTGNFGGNFGLGYRFATDWADALGASFWYDSDDTTGRLFQQTGVGLEMLADYWDVRANGYFPVGDQEQLFHERLLSQRFQGHSIIYDYHRLWGEAMPGFDLEAGVLLPGSFAREHDLRVSAGWYRFFGDRTDDIDGFKARIQGDVAAGFSSQVEFTTDDTFGTNVMLGVAWAYDAKFRGRNERERRDRLTDFAHRNYNVIVAEDRERVPGLLAINPATGQPYVVQHVSSGGLGISSTTGAQDGSLDTPFGSIAAAQAAGGDLIFVQSGSVLSEGIVLRSGDRIFGEGGNHFIEVAGRGNVLLPGMTGGTNRPIIVGSAGDAVVLAPNSTFAGFIIDGATGNGLSGSGLSNVFVSDVDVRNVHGAGVFLQNSVGPVTLESMRIENAAGPALHVLGGGAEIAFGGMIHNDAGYALLVENTTGGLVDLSGAEVHENGGQGVRLGNAAGDVSVGTVVVESGTASGIDIQGGSGDFSFDDVTIAGTAGPGVNIANATGTTSFQALKVTSVGAAALQAIDSGKVTIAGGSLAASGGSAAIIRDTSMDVLLTSLSSTGAAYGLELVNTPGQFLVSGTGTLGSGGTIQNSTLAGIFLDNAGTVGLQELNVADNAIGIDVRNSDHIGLSRVQVTNSAGYGLTARNTGMVEINSSGFAGNGAPGGSTIHVASDTVGNSSVILTGSTINASVGDAIRLETLAGGEGSDINVTMESNVITTAATGASGFRADWDGGFTAKLTNNAFGAVGGSSSGVLIDLPSTTDSSSIAIGGNVFELQGSDSVAIDVTGAGASSLNVASNLVRLFETNGTGLEFSLAGGSGVQVQNNSITDFAGGGTGILFQSMTGTSNVAINNNTVDLRGALPDRGIIFSSISGTVNLSGTQNNQVKNASQAFFAPAGGTSGQILVNGVAVP